MSFGRAGFFRFQPKNVKRQVNPICDVNFAKNYAFYGDHPPQGLSEVRRVRKVFRLFRKLIDFVV